MNDSFQIGDLTVEPQLNRISSCDRKVQMESKAMEVLVFLSEHPREVQPKERIIRAVWPDTFVSDDVLTHAVSELRKAFRDDPRNPRFIQTIPRKGYRLIADVAKPEPESRYRKLGTLGQGAMGEVFLAEDQLLKRKVALKFVLEEADDESGRRRLEREALAAAGLDHPFICKIYETGELKGRTFIAMEYVPGQTLKERLSGGPLPPAEAIRVAIEMAEALEIAHANGIVHRDLKPSNVILTEQGHVKITDFGIAKRLVTADGDDRDFTATLAVERCSPGTLPYMSPEQVKGQEVDTRSDIFSLGVLLYEMLSGVHPFRKPLPMETAAAIQTEIQTPLTRYAEGIPELAQHTVGKMLAKDLEGRYSSVQDVRTNLEKLLEDLGRSPEVTAATRTGGRRWIPWAEFPQSGGAAWWKKNLVLVLVGLVTIVAGGLSVLYFGGTQVRPTLLRARLSKPNNLLFQNPDSPVISPDGRLVVISGLNKETGARQLWLHRLASQTVQTLDGTKGAVHPFWSPDSRFVGFKADGKLKKIALSGGLPIVVTDLPPRNWGGSAWSRGGIILLSSFQDGLYRVSSAGGVATRLTLYDETRQEWFHGFPNFLSDGEHFLYRALSAQQPRRFIKLGALSTGESRALLNEESALFAPPGYLLFRRQSTLMAQPFDTEQLELAGKGPLPLVEGLRTTFDVQNFSISENGILVYRSPAKGRLRWWDRAGRRLDSVADPGPYTQIALSPDEKYVAVEQDSGIWLLELSSGVFSRFGSGGDAVWSPDSRQLLFTSSRAGPPSLFVKSIGSSEVESVFQQDHSQYPEDWSPDGQAIYLSPGGGRTVYGIDLRSPDGKPQLLFESDFNTEEHRVSPDGHWIAFCSKESGRWEVHLATFPDFAKRRQVSVGGGIQPQWRRDGTELFYLRPDGTLMSVEVRPGPDTETGAPRTLFETGIKVNVLWNQYCVTADGQRFLTVEPESEDQIELIINWPELLRQTPDE